MDQTIDPNRIKWSVNKPKREADRVLYRAIAMDIFRVAWQGPIDVLSFPGPSWVWEKGLTRSFDRVNFHYAGLERDAKVFQKLKRNASKLGLHHAMTRRPESFCEFAARRDKRHRQFGIIYLDWMGTWSKEKKHDLDLLFQGNMLKVGGVLILTVALQRGQPVTNDELLDLSYELPMSFHDARGSTKYIGNPKVRGVPRWVTNMTKERYGVGMQPVMASVYYSRAGTSLEARPQLQIVMRRES